MNRHGNNRVLTLALLLSALPCLSAFDVLKRANRDVEEGNRLMQAGKAKEALEQYQKAIGSGLGDPSAEMNRGVALSALGRHDEAVQAFLQATRAKDNPSKARAFFNLGNSFFRGDKWPEAIEAYKRALTLDPTQQDAKWNLELALRKQEEKKKQDEKQKQDQKDKQDPNNKDKQKQDKNQQDKNQDKQDKNQDKNQDKQDPSQKKKDEPSEKKEPDPPKPEPKDDKKPAAPEPKPEAKPPEKPESQQTPAEIGAILDSLERSPKDLEREQARIRAVRRRPPEKDW